MEDRGVLYQRRDAYTWTAWASARGDEPPHSAMARFSLTLICLTSNARDSW